MICIYDKSAIEQDFKSNGLGILHQCLKAQIDLNLNGDYSLYLEYDATDFKAKYLVELNIIKANDQLFRIYKVERSHANHLKLNIWARHIFYDLAYFFIESSKIVNATMHDAMEVTIPPEAQDRFNIKAPQANLAPFTVEQINAVDAIFKLIEVYGGEVERDNFNVSFKDKLGRENGVTLRYGKNIKGLTATEDASEMATRIFPVGENGLVLPERYIEVKGNKLLPFDITKKVELKYCQDEDELRREALLYLESSIIPKLHIQVDFLELSKTEQYKEFKYLTSIEVGDLVDVFHEGLSITTKLRVIRKQIDLLNPVNTKIELGNPLNNIIEKLDDSRIIDEMNKLIAGNKTGVVIKKNTESLNILNVREAAISIGITTKADTNLNCNITFTGEGSADGTLSIFFSLDGLEYYLKPVQRLVAGHNILSFSLPMPQVQVGSHQFLIEMMMSSGTFKIEKNNMQVSIEGLHIEGGLSATLPRIGIIYPYLFSMFIKKLKGYQPITECGIENAGYNFLEVGDIVEYLVFYNELFKLYTDWETTINLKEIGIFESFYQANASKYNFDHSWITWETDSDKLSDGKYEVYDCVSIKEPLLENNGECIDSESDAIYMTELPNFNQFNQLVSLEVQLTKKEGE